VESGSVENETKHASHGCEHGDSPTAALNALEHLMT
jgi:hypothetical protein